MLQAYNLEISFSVLNNDQLPFFLIQPFQGDNYCDAMNNREYCNYDGGDCCQSTVKTKKVKLAFIYINFFVIIH